MLYVLHPFREIEIGRRCIGRVAADYQKRIDLPGVDGLRQLREVADRIIADPAFD